MKLAGRVAVITGGASGLGEATARRFIKEGCKVVIADLNEDQGTEFAKSLGPDKALFVKTNVADESSVKNTIEKTLDKFKTVNILLNAAGIFKTWSLFEDQCNAENFMKLLSVNLIGTFNMTKAASSVMIKNEPLNEVGERGVIISIASIAATEGGPSTLFYSASKGAVSSMTLPLARDLGQYGIRVMTISPGIFMTPMGNLLPKGVVEMAAQGTALGRNGNPSEFADLCYAICMNSYLTGSVIRFDAGLRLGHAQPVKNS